MFEDMFLPNFFHKSLLKGDGPFLPLLDVVHLDDHHDDLDHQVVPHVNQTSNLRSYNPNHTEPPDSNVEEDATEEVSNDAADDGPNDMLDGFFVIWRVGRWSRSHLNPEVSVLQILPGHLQDDCHGEGPGRRG